MAAATAKTIPEKGQPVLTLGDRIDIIKNKRVFPLIFPLVMLAVLFMVFAILTQGDFLKDTVLKGIFNQSLIVGTMATAVSFIYTTGNIDFSVGSVMGLAAVFGGLVYRSGGNMATMIVVIFAGGILLMLLNCTLGVMFRVKPAMVAVVAMAVYNAMTIVLVGAQPIAMDYKMCKALESTFRPVTFIIYFVICLFVFHKTEIGRTLKFIGGNEVCAEQTGMNVVKAQYGAFILAGIGIGLAGVYQVLRTANIAQGVGNGTGMDVMLATVLGGMSIFGGARSNAFAGFIGALTVTILDKGLLMLGVPSTLIQGARGILFLLLVFLNSERQSTLPSRQQF